MGIATVISKRAVAEIPPLALLSIQLAMSLAVLSLALLATGQRVRWTSDTRRLGALGVLNPGLSYALGLLGLAQITASLSVLLWALEPVLILVLAWWVLKERITFQVALGSIAALAGAMLALVEAGSTGTVLGIALTLAGVFACAIYTVLSRKVITGEATLGVVAVQQAFALLFALLLLTAASAIRPSPDLSHVSFEAWVSALVAGVLYYAVAFGFYLAGLRRVSAGEAGMFLNLIPIFGIAASYLLLGERLSVRQWISAIVIVVAVSAISRSLAKRRELVAGRLLV